MRWAILIGVMFALIIIPFLIFEKQFEALGAWLAEGHASGWVSAATIGGLLALDVFLPVPSSIVSTGAGVLLGFWRGAAVIWVGMTIGCAIGYAFGAKAEAAARRLVGTDGLARAHQIMERHGNWAIVLCRPIPDPALVRSALPRQEPKCPAKCEEQAASVQDQWLRAPRP